MQSVCFEYSLQYFVEENSDNNITKYCTEELSSIQSLLDNRFLICNAYRNIIRYKYSDNSKSNFSYEDFEYLSRKFPNKEKVNAIVRFAWWENNDKITRKEFELTSFFQNEKSQIENLETEMSFYKANFPTFLGISINEFEEFEDKVTLHFVDNFNTKSLLGNNYIINPIEYHLSVQLIDKAGNTHFSLNKVFNTQSSILNRTNSMIFIAGVYAALKIHSIMSFDKEPESDETINFKDHPCYLKRNIMLKKYTGNSEPIEIDFKNNFKESKQNLFLLKLEHFLFNLKKINFVTTAEFYNNDTVSFGMYDTKRPWPNQYEDSIIWNQKPESIFNTVYPNGFFKNGHFLV